MNYPYLIPPNIQSTMAQAMQAVRTGNPLPSNCFMISMPMQQVQQMFPQLMMNYTHFTNPITFGQQPSYYNQLYQPQIDPYLNNYQQNSLVPYSNYYSQGYNQNSNRPIVPSIDYNNKSTKQSDYYNKNPVKPHPNVYNSSSFDSHMQNLSWSRLFGQHHHRRQHNSKQQNQDKIPLSYNQKANSLKKRRSHSADSLTSLSTTNSKSSSSTTTTSDETIRRMNIATKQQSNLSTSKQQTKSSLPFKYSSEFVPAVGKQQLQKSNKKDLKIKPDDVFVVKKTQQIRSSSHQ